jgi:hypothetical protein
LFLKNSFLPGEVVMESGNMDGRKAQALGFYNLNRKDCLVTCNDLLLQKK